MGLILNNGIVVSHVGPIYNGAVAFEADRIVGVGKSEEVIARFPNFEIIDVASYIVMPGLVNAHTHAAMSILRGVAEDLPLHDWLEKKIWPLESKLTPKDIELGALLGAYEALLSGTTTLNSMYFYFDEGSEVHAFAKVGIRAVVGHGFFERTWEEGLKITSYMARKWHGAENGRIRVSVDPHAVYSTGPRAYKEAHELMIELNNQIGDRGKIIMHTHLAESPHEAALVKQNFGIEFDGGVVNYLHQLGALSENMLAAHMIHLDDYEISILSEKNVSIALNPISNLKVGMGVAPYIKLHRAGLRIGLGTDSATSNNTLDMFETMKLLPLLQKGLSRDASVVPAREAFEAATIGGARALGWGEEIGLIKEGYKADLVVLDIGNLHSVPLYDVYSHLVYSARCGDVVHVFVDGKHIVDNGMIVGLNHDEFIKRVNEAKDSLISRI